MDQEAFRKGSAAVEVVGEKHIARSLEDELAPTCSDVPPSEVLDFTTTTKVSKARGISVIATLSSIHFLNTMGSGILIAALPRIADDVGLDDNLILVSKIHTNPFPVSFWCDLITRIFTVARRCLRFSGRLPPPCLRLCGRHPRAQAGVDNGKRPFRRLHYRLGVLSDGPANHPFPHLSWRGNVNVPPYNGQLDHQHIPQGQMAHNLLRDEWHGAALGICTGPGTWRNIHRYRGLAMGVLDHGHHHFLRGCRVILVAANCSTPLFQEVDAAARE